MGMVATLTATAAAVTLSVTPANQNVTSSSGTTSFSVISNSNWNVVSNATWCTVPSTGTGNGIINVVYSANSSFTQRIATISVSVAGLPVQNVTVTQDAATRTLSVTPPSQSVTQNAGTTAFDVISNTTWTVVSDAAWCAVTPSGTGNGNITATYATNSTTASRIASISVFVTGLPVQIVTVIQEASTVGVVENHDQTIRIFPNPSRGLFKVAMENTSAGEIEVSLLDISGRTILTETINGSSETTFELSEAPRGYYFVRLKSDSGTSVRRVIIID
jgi:hypothetical protein